jgi:hypothetical protein
MSRNLIDSIKDLQQVLETFVNEHLIKELLLESTFGDSVLDEENVVVMKFREIDVDAQIKKENHSADLFEKDILTHDEARRRIGEDPLLIPTREEMESGEDLAEKFPDWHRTRWKLFEEPELLIKAIDEPWSTGAKAAAGNRAIGLTSTDTEESADEQREREVTLEKEKTKAKVAVAKAKPRPSVKRDGFLETTFVQIKKDIVSYVSETNKLDRDWVAALIRAQMSPTINRLVLEQLVAFRNGYSTRASIETDRFVQSISLARTQLRERAERHINRLTENVIASLKRNVVDEDLVTSTRAVFESVQFRTKFIEDVEVRKATNLGIALAVKDNYGGKFASTMRKADNEEICIKCSSKNGIELSTEYITLDDLPPHHANCGCSFTHIVGGTTTIQNSKDGISGSADNPDNLPETVVQPCPKCGKTAIKVDAPDAYKCKACNNVFTVVLEDNEDINDRSKRSPRSTSAPKSKKTAHLRCILRAKARIAERHPEWDQDRVAMMAEASCEYLLDMADKVEENLEDDKLEENQE